VEKVEKYSRYAFCSTFLKSGKIQSLRFLLHFSQKWKRWKNTVATLFAPLLLKVEKIELNNIM
jgi:uncharacterized membrane protein